MIRLVVWGVLLLALGFSAGADDASQPPVEDGVWKGRYKMWLSGDSAWHQNAVEIDGVTVEEMEGTVEVDLGLGPEAREPNADETLHKVKFKARRQSDQSPYVAEVMVGSVQPKVYRFEMFPMETGKCWSGVVSVGSRKAGLLVRRD
jgi:hypothetical protein